MPAKALPELAFRPCLLKRTQCRPELTAEGLPRVCLDASHAVKALDTKVSMPFAHLVLPNPV
jgi:hypothetical protein